MTQKLHEPIRPIPCKIGPELKLPLFVSTIEAGFPSPAENTLDKALDLNELLIHHPEATFFVRVSGDSMIKAGISEGDLLIVDRSLSPAHGKIVIAVVDGEFTVKRLELLKDQVILRPENDNYEPIVIRDQQDLIIWGVVTSVIHNV